MPADRLDGTRGFFTSGADAVSDQQWPRVAPEVRRNLEGTGLPDFGVQDRACDGNATSLAPSTKPSKTRAATALARRRRAATSAHLRSSGTWRRGRTHPRPATAGRGRDGWGLPLTSRTLTTREENIIKREEKLMQFSTCRCFLDWIKPSDPVHATRV